MKKIKRNRLIFLILISILIISPTGTRAATKAERVESVYVVPGGEPFGIKMFSDGLMVTDIEGFSINDKEVCPAKAAGLQKNDIIYSANGRILYSNNELKSIIENSEGESVKLKIKRNNKFLDIELKPVKDCNNIYKAGLWVKDSAAGLGTITFYCEESKSFCGLGHGICDKDTKALVPLSYGELDKACISSVTKSVCGNVGTLNGYFTDDVIGNAVCNHETGIYGHIKSNNTGKNKIEIADKNEVAKGMAYIYTTVNGECPEKYEVEITKINLKEETVNLTVRITDKRLIDETGGIVQGMSGSPIIQNGKLVGALTHVLVDNVDYGYGIFAQTMYEIMCKTC